MSLDLSARIVDDGQVALEWAPRTGKFQSYWLLAIRTGAKPGFTTLKLDGGTRKYRFANLGRHQRYRFAVMAARNGQQVCSPWLSATPRAGFDVVNDDGEGITAHLATLSRLMVMPQDRRLTLYWQLGTGFVDKVVLDLRRETTLLATYELEPEVRSFTLDAGRCPQLTNDVTYTLTARARFALTHSAPCTVVCTPAPQGQEREANRAHPQRHLVYPCLSLAPELDVFGEGATGETAVQITCGRCRGPTEWRDYTLRCRSCHAEFIANHRGDYLDVARLRFGTCRCCLPRKLLIQDLGSDSLRCAHSGKEHIRMPGQSTHMLIEDLPHGLCQCCRPRRPLLRNPDGSVRCSKSNEIHRRSEGEDGTYVLVPSAPIFDAAAIDELLDAGLADICASGVSRGRR
ncbi:MAG: fibronectin type III domain-containing protein [Myxococcota bacterium]